MSTYYSVSHLGHFSPKEVHELYKLRVDTFVTEQKRTHEEIDDYDPQPTTLHITARDGGRLVGCARVVPRMLDDGERVLHFGRFALHPDARGKGVAQEIMTNTLRLADTQFSDRPVYLNAQAPLEEYYEQYGFRRCGETFDIAGMAHVPMMRPLQG